MEGNICAECLEKVNSLENMMSAIKWGKCKVCGGTGVFYARKDEIEDVKRLIKLNEQHEENKMDK